MYRGQRLSLWRNVWLVEEGLQKYRNITSFPNRKGKHQTIGSALQCVNSLTLPFLLLTLVLASFYIGRLQMLKCPCWTCFSMTTPAPLQPQPTVNSSKSLSKKGGRLVTTMDSSQFFISSGCTKVKSRTPCWSGALETTRRDWREVQVTSLGVRACHIIQWPRTETGAGEITRAGAGAVTLLLISIPILLPILC